MNSVAVSYWSGNLPSVSKLHFLSFKYMNDCNFKYVLYVDTDSKLKSETPADLNWLLEEPWFELRFFSLQELMARNKILDFSRWNNNILDKIVRRIKKKYLRIGLKLLSKFLREHNEYVDTHFNKEIGFTFSHNQNFAGLSQHLTYRSDVFRSLIASEYPISNVLYVDIDICFVKKFSSYDWSNAFTSPWGLAEFANTAIIYLPAKNQQLRSRIISEFRKVTSAWPWTLYSKNRCEFYGLELRSIEEFDPPWALSNPSTGDSGAFMKKHANAQNIVDWADSNSFCYHWHNQWNVIPEAGSPYDIYLNRFQ